MDVDGTKWITLREAEKIIERSRRQIWRYVHDGSWDTRAVMDNLNRPVTYVRLDDILMKKAEIESAANLNTAPITEKEISSGVREDGEPELIIVQQQLERLIANQEHQNNLLKRCLYILERINLTSLKFFVIVILVGIVIIAACSILNFISD